MKSSQQIMFLIFSIPLILAIFVTGFVLFSEPAEAPTAQNASTTTAVMDTHDEAVLNIDDERLSLHVADTAQEKRSGLSGRKTLSDDEGMIFVYDSLGYPGIWMKNMYFPIDVLWLDKDFFVVHAESGITPDTFPRTFRPDEPARYVLEVRAGFIDRFNVQVGGQLDISIPQIN